MDQSTIEQLQAAAMRNEIDWEINGVPVRLHKLYIDDLIELSGNISSLIVNFANALGDKELKEAAAGNIPSISNLETMAIACAGIIKPIVSASILTGEEDAIVRGSLEKIIGQLPAETLIDWLYVMRKLYPDAELKRLYERFFGLIKTNLGIKPEGQSDT